MHVSVSLLWIIYTERLPELFKALLIVNQHSSCFEQTPTVFCVVVLLDFNTRLRCNQTHINLIGFMFALLHVELVMRSSPSIYANGMAGLFVCKLLWY